MSSNETNNFINSQTLKPENGPITILPSLSATLNNSQHDNNLNDSIDINTLLDKYKIKDSKEKLSDPVIENVLKNLISSTLAQEKTVEPIQQQQHQADKILNQSVLSSLLKPVKDDLNEINDNQNNNDTIFGPQQTNKMSMTSQSINLIREYEREIKRQDTNLIENTLINTITSLNKNKFDKNEADEEDIMASPRSVDGGNNNDDEETTYNSRVSTNAPAVPEGYEIKRRK